MNTPLRILLVEDSEDDAQLVLVELRRAGYQVVFERVATELDLEAALDRGAWDVIVADFSMPGFSGRAALDIVLRRGLDTPFVFVSGTIGEDTAVEAMKAGAGDYVMKENLRRLVPAIERELREATVRRERHAAEEALRRSEARFATVVAASPVGMSLSTLGEGRYVDVNPSFLRMLGYVRDQIVGRTAAELGVWANPAERDGVIAELQRSGAITNRDVAVRTKNGEVRSTLCNFELIETGGESCLAAFVVDVTERRRLEEQLEQAQRLEAIGRLAAGVAHDFNNLLTVVIGCCDLVSDGERGGESPPPEIAEIRRAAEAAAALTRQLLAFGRKQVLQPRQVDVSEVVGQAGKLLERLIGAHVELVTRLAPAGSAVVLADRSQLEQVIVNLAVNARDAMAGGGRLRIETAVVELDREDAARIAAGRQGRFVRLTVADSGAGMDANTLDHLFEPFFTTKEVGKGTGLGLATVYGVVAQSGGFLHVESEPGRGSEFEVYLPWIEGSALPEKRPTPAPPASDGKETILLVEDDNAVRELTHRLLQQLGYTVLAAPEGSSAMRLVREHSGPIHLMITDLVMPGMSGRTLAERVLEIRPDVRVLLTSGYASEDALRSGLLAGELAYLEKPFSSSALAQKVRELLALG
ncbi:MAG TPA: response regulator [Thermoanaerobaculia bacterium]